MRARESRPHGLGCDEQQLALMVRATEKTVTDSAIEATDLPKNGGDRKSENYQGVVNTLIRGATNADYLTARIKRDRPDILERMKAGDFAQHEPWKVYPPEAPYGSLDALLKAEIGVDVKESFAVVKARAENFDGSELPKAEIGTGKAGPGRGHKTTVVNSRFMIGTTNADYLTARIARDHKDIHRRMKTGEFSSVRQAAKEAGLVQT